MPPNGPPRRAAAEEENGGATTTSWPSGNRAEAPRQDAGPPRLPQGRHAGLSSPISCSTPLWHAHRRPHPFDQRPAQHPTRSEAEPARPEARSRSRCVVDIVVLSTGTLPRLRLGTGCSARCSNGANETRARAHGPALVCPRWPGAWPRLPQGRHTPPRQAIALGHRADSPQRRRAKERRWTAPTSRPPPPARREASPAAGPSSGCLVGARAAAPSPPPSRRPREARRPLKSRPPAAHHRRSPGY